MFVKVHANPSISEQNVNIQKCEVLGHVGPSIMTFGPTKGGKCHNAQHHFSQSED